VLPSAGTPVKTMSSPRADPEMSKPLLSVTLKDVLSKLVSFSVDLVIS
jgi:hypothetical protein